MRILIVDDSKTVRFIIIKILKELGYSDLMEAGDVTAAIKLLESEPLPGLIFSDLNMPGRNGIEFLKYVRSNSQTATIPFIMITTVHDKKTVFEAVRAGLQYYLFKPIDKALLSEKLQALTLKQGFQAPLISASQKSPLSKNSSDIVVSLEGVEEGESKSEVKSEVTDTADGEASRADVIEKLVEHFFLVFDGELTLQDFQAWCVKEIAAYSIQFQGKDIAVDEIVSKLRTAAKTGITTLFTAK
ncbi:MAG: response regulator [Chitinivibrionales bacterium]|nr:response regulator [Chitinivibrionales bacterium]